MAIKYLQEFVKELSQSLPPSVEQVKNELLSELQLGLPGLLKKMDLVDRQEFDIQTEVLRKARIKLQALEEKISLLEKQKLPNSFTRMD